MSPNAGLTGNTVIFFKKRETGRKLAFASWKNIDFLTITFNYIVTVISFVDIVWIRKVINIFIETSFPGGRNLSHALRNNLAKLKKPNMIVIMLHAIFFKYCSFSIRSRPFVSKAWKKKAWTQAPSEISRYVNKRSLKALFFLLCGKIFCYILHCKNSKPVCYSLQLHCN